MKPINKYLQSSLMIIFILTSFSLTFAQSNYSETLTITTYYPSPYGVYRNLEVKSGLAVGDITQGPLNSMDNLTSGQLYINNSLVLNSLPGTPVPAFSKAGQVIYVNNTISGERMLKFYNDTAWVNATCSTCIANQTCGACPTGTKMCYANCTEGSTCAACPITAPQCRPACAACNSCCATCSDCPTGSIAVSHYAAWGVSYTRADGTTSGTSAGITIPESWSTSQPCVTVTSGRYMWPTTSTTTCAAPATETKCLRP